MIITINQDLSKPSISSRSLADEGIVFELLVDEVPVVTAPSGESVSTVDDVNITTQSSSTYYNDFEIGIVYLGPNPEFFGYESLNPEIATVDQTGKVSLVSHGQASILCQAGLFTKRVEVDNNLIESAVVNISYEFASGSLGEHFTNNVLGRLVGKSAASSLNLYSSQDHVSLNFVRNPNSWASDLDLTCISPSNSDSNNRKAGTLLTPRHIVIATHYEYQIGTAVRFVDNSNNVYERTVIQKVRTPGYVPHFPDFTICLLSSDLPAEISPCKVLPANFGDYLVQIDFGSPYCIKLDQEEKGIVERIKRMDDYIATRFPPVGTDAREFSEISVIGDSGNPIFFIGDTGSGDELIFVSVLTGAGSGTNVAMQISNLNQMIADADAAAGISTGYTLTEADFSSFPTY